MNKKDKNMIQKNVSELKSLNGSRNSKYLRNYRSYWNTPRASLKNIRNLQTVGYWINDYGVEEDTTETPNLNIIKSCIDTLTSKIAQSKVRPFFNTVQGSFKDIQVVKQSQIFFDLFYDKKNVTKEVPNCFRDACIFDTGCLYINEVTKDILRVVPNQVYVRPSEVNYDCVTRVYMEQYDYPSTLINKDYGNIKEIKDAIKDQEYVTFGLYYDIFNHIKGYLINDAVVYYEPYEADVVPFVFLHFSSPVAGNTSASVVDMLISIQNEVNILMTKIKDASQLSPSNTIFVPEGSNVKTSQLNNRVGQIVEYKMSPNMTTSPVSVATPSFISEQYMATVERLVDQAYNMVGLSQLSAQSQKPTGLDSGIALSTMENIESDRFETQLNQVIRCYVDIAKICLKVFPAGENILPEDTRRVSVKWGDIVKESEKMTIQFSAADSLSKDPSTKLQQLQNLAQAGIIPRNRISQLLELPDLQTGYSLSNNAINAVMTIISDCIDENMKLDSVDDIPDYIPFQMLKEEIINTQLSLKAAQKNQENMKDIERLTKLYQLVEEKEQMFVTETAEEAAANTAEGTEMLPGQENILTQEAASTKVPEVTDEVQGTEIDMDLTSPQGDARNGQWNS